MAPTWWLTGITILLSILATIVNLVAALLFFIAYQTEKKIFTLWRPLGFSLLALGFAVAALPSAAPTLTLTGLTIELLAYVCIYYGVLSEPILSQLRQVSSRTERSHRHTATLGSRFPRGSSLVGVLALLTGIYFLDGEYLITTLAVLSVLAIALTLRLQIKRYQWEQDSRAIRRQNLYPLLAYAFLLLRSLGLALYYLPWPTTPALATALYSGLLVATLLALFYLAVWAWVFVRVRIFLRTSFLALIFLTLAWMLGILLVIPLIIVAILFFLSFIRP